MKTTPDYESLEPGRKLVVFAFLVVTTWYLTWRLGTFNRQALIFSWLLYAAELYGIATTLMHLFMTWRLTVRKAPAAPEGFSVDVFVTTINEPVALVRKTLLAVTAMSYPHETWLLDDGKRPEMEALSRELGCRYLVRDGNQDAKAGNLNNALRHAKGQFVAVFDADHAPKKGFLEKALGYFTDPEVAFVQTPQDFYNLDSFQHHGRHGALAWHEQSVFFRVIQRGKDYWNAAFFCGSCAVLRRSALDAIGGFATGTVTEDLHTSIKIHKKGFRSVYHAESLAFGLAPSEVGSFLNQRVRWGEGAMQVWRKEGVFFCRGLTMAQRINYLASSITYFDGWQKGFFYIIPAIVLLSGVMPITTFGKDFLLHFIPYFLLTFWVFEEVNRGYGRSVTIEQYNMARFAALAWSTLGLFRGKVKFAVTPKGTAPPATTGRLIAPQAVVMGLNCLAIVAGAVLYRLYHHLPQSAFLANLLWAGVNSGLAVAVIRFVSAQGKHRRQDYRFHIPFPAIVQFGDGNKSACTIDDISSAGCRIYTAVPDGTEVGTEVSGALFLPSRSLRFKATVKTVIRGFSGGQQYVKSIGCSFLREGSELDELDRFLYGSDIQWSINHLREAIQTPLELMNLDLSKQENNAGDAESKWNAISYSPADDTHRALGLISARQAGDRQAVATILAYRPLQPGEQLKVDVYGHRGISSLTGSVGRCRRIETPLAPMFSCEFVPATGGAS
ncbi:MAG TPA: glycosyltransferase [Geomonas sp.]|nr:glycosyltransferase [Geomonas sp.]